MENQSQNYIRPGVSAGAVNRFFRETRAANLEIHTLQVWHGDDCLLRVAPEPYNCTDRREVYSLSKTFCSTAIGVLVDQGKLHVDDRIVDIFPDKLPETVSENLAAMRLKHVLSMNTGHDGCVMSQMIHASDPVAAFLALPVPNLPGTHFAYNTGATLLLSAIVEHVTGETLYDFLTRTVLFPIGCRDVVWNRTNPRLNEGGVGIQITSDDIIRLGRLYLNRGVWDGKRILSETWIDAATYPHSDNSMNGTPDWKSGYGYQIWNNAGDGYRGDGARGQLMVVLPESNMLIAVQAMVPNMQLEVDHVVDLAAHIFDADSETLDIPPFAVAAAPTEPLPLPEDAYYKAEENIFGFTMFHLYRTSDGIVLDASDGRQVYRLSAGAGKYLYSAYTLPYRRPKLLNLMLADIPETTRCAAFYTVEDDRCVIHSRHLTDPHNETITLAETDGTLRVTFDVGGFILSAAREVVAKKI